MWVSFSVSETHRVDARRWLLPVAPTRNKLAEILPNRAIVCAALGLRFDRVVLDSDSGYLYVRASSHGPHTCSSVTNGIRRTLKRARWLGDITTHRGQIVTYSEEFIRRARLPREVAA